MTDGASGNAMTRGTARFYDELAEHYHLIFEDWDTAVVRQGVCLDRLVRDLAGPGPKRILDATCGIGTQALGLARHGHRVAGSDLSARAIARARREAARLDLRLDLACGDVRALSHAVTGGFDVVCALDNALPHLASDADLALALAEMSRVARPGGWLLISLRDYDRLVAERPRVTPPSVVDAGDETRLVFQLWDWAADGGSYRLQLVILRLRPGASETLVFPAAYRALTRNCLTGALAASGLTEVRWMAPEESGFFQPLVAARVPERSG